MTSVPDDSGRSEAAAQPGTVDAGTVDAPRNTGPTGTTDLIGTTGQMGALELAAAIRAGDVDVHQVAEEALAAASTVGAQVGAYAHVLPELTHSQADAVAERLADARTSDDMEDLAARYPLLGVPMPIKDLTRIAGQPFSAGSAVLEHNIAEVTDGVAERIIEAGTLTVGKTTVPEFGMPCYTEPAFGAPARTPWDTRRTAGGSSGGAAAAVASGIVPIAHGNDGGGSVRIPAACCGVLGLKPSRGLISAGPHSQEGPGLAVDGVLARTVTDLAAGMDAMVHTRPGDPFPLHGPESGYLHELTRGMGASVLPPLKIAVLTEPLNIDTTVHPAALRGVERARELLTAHGHECTEVPAPFTPAQWRTFMPLWTVGAASIEVPPAAEPMLMELTRWLREQGRSHSGVAVSAALAGMQSLSRTIGEAFAQFDAVLTPSLSGPPAFPHDLQLPDGGEDFDAQCRFTPWTSTWNMTGRAAISVPLHREQIEGTQLPFGVHLGAVRAGDDLLLLRLAQMMEAADPWPLTHAPVAAR